MLSLAASASPQGTTVIVCGRPADHLIRIVYRSRVSVQIKHMTMHRSVDDTDAMTIVRRVDSVIIVFHIFVFDVLVVVIVECWVVPCVDEVGMMRRWRRRQGKVTESGAIAVVVRVVDHTGIQSRTASTVEVLAKADNTIAREDTKDFALMVVELCRSFAAEDGQIVAEEGLNSCQTQMGQARAVV